MAGRCCHLSLPGFPSSFPDTAGYTLFFLEAIPVKLHGVLLDSSTCMLSSSHPQVHWFSLKFRTQVINFEKSFCLTSWCNPSSTVSFLYPYPIIILLQYSIPPFLYTKHLNIEALDSSSCTYISIILLG